MFDLRGARDEANKLHQLNITALCCASTFLLLLAAGCQRHEDTALYQAACHGPPLHGAAEFEQAQVDGYQINRRFNCIDKASYEAVTAEKARWEAAHAPQAIAKREAEIQRKTQDDVESLAQARSGFTTKISFAGREPAAPQPPAKIFGKIRYPSSAGSLAAYLTPDPGDGQRHPAIIWITGGDSNSIGEVWQPGSRDNEQTAAAYRNAGIVMMFPSLRGGNDNPGREEAFYGEVDDVLAAHAFLSTQPYVDPDRIFLGGHSTGGTLALLTAEFRNPFRAVFAFGPVHDVGGYGKGIFPIDLSRLDARERKLRSPGYWLHALQGQVFVIEGMNAPSNIAALEMMKNAPHPAGVHFEAVAGASHFSVLAPTNERIAQAILADRAATGAFTWR
ncbi:MAG TPA: prolyl oligopeptidase family serine peptidase [Rudaea sp.]|nr:prolyl oligopeptidase family serine peptidase [Rudaea sp.]